MLIELPAVIDAASVLATGAWLAAVMAMVALAEPARSPPPVLPLSWTVRVRLVEGLTAALLST